MIVLRCPHRKFGELIVPAVNDAELAIACPSRWCGKRSGVVIIHSFNIKTGELVHTRQFRSPEGGK